MKSLNTLTGDALEQMIDYKVVDQTGTSIGTLHSLWSDPTTGMVEFLGVKTGWLFGHNHVVPAGKAELDDKNGVVRLPYTEIFIKEAPSMSADAEISEVEEDDIFRYYGLPRRGTMSGADLSDVAPGNTPRVTANPPAVVTSADAEAMGSSSKYAGEPVSSGDLQSQNLLNLDHGDMAAGNYRLRRTARPVAAAIGAADSAGESGPTIGGMTSPTNDDFINGGAAAITTGEGSGVHGMSGYDPDASPLGDASLTGSRGVADDIGGNTATTLLTGSEDYTGTDQTTVLGSTATTDNADPLTGEHGAHPVGTGVGAVSAGAAGMAIGSVGGPIGAIIGGIAGAVVGGLAGKGLAESVNPTVEDAANEEKI